ncbi:MAG TPA: hypothetical protein VGY49_11805 [Burkholderiaceae bacterium]|jgi:hypothetical protein|nr:hypothetical protein [Burkholderiaceae bacterium]
MTRKLSLWTAAIRHRAELLANAVRRGGRGWTHGHLSADEQVMRSRYFGLLVHVDRADR